MSLRKDPKWEEMGDLEHMSDFFLIPSVSLSFYTCEERAQDMLSSNNTCCYNPVILTKSTFYPQNDKGSGRLRDLLTLSKTPREHPPVPAWGGRGRVRKDFLEKGMLS